MTPPNSKSSNKQEKALPTNNKMGDHHPFCCTSAIPSTFTHLLAYVGETTSHVLLNASPSTPNAGLLTTFLASAAMSLFYSRTITPALPPHVILRPGGSFRAIIQVTKRVATLEGETVTKEWFAPYGIEDRERIVVGGLEKLFWVLWSEISKEEADECLRPEGCGIEIGDGEIWEEVVGRKETLWCDAHNSLWDMKVFVRKS